MDDGVTRPYQMCMHHAGHSARIGTMEKEITIARIRLDKQDERMDKLAVEHAKITAKFVAGVAVAQALLQVGLKLLG